jgi:hypothetical protein
MTMAALVHSTCPRILGLALKFALIILLSKSEVLGFCHPKFVAYTSGPGISGTHPAQRIFSARKQTPRVQIHQGSFSYIPRTKRLLLVSRIKMKQETHNSEAFLDDLLCQRAVQTQLYYFAEFRDG